MNSQLLFWIYFVGGIVLLLVFLSGRKSSHQPTKLNLRGQGKSPSEKSLNKPGERSSLDSAIISEVDSTVNSNVALTANSAANSAVVSAADSATDSASKSVGPNVASPGLNQEGKHRAGEARERGSKIEILPPEGKLESGSAAAASAKAKNLNAIFMFNGHDWDAYAVLGVPAGSPLPLVTKAYQNALRTADPTTFEFLEMAYKAILKSTQGYRL